MLFAHPRNSIALAALAALLASVSACNQDHTKPVTAAAESPPVTPASPQTDTAGFKRGKETQAGTEAHAAQVGAILDLLVPHYDVLRVALVHDNGHQAIDAAIKLAEAATKAKESAPQPLVPRLDMIAMQATFIAGGDAAKLGPLRTAFGEISRALVAILYRGPQEVASKYILFECPVAQGFNRWIQTDERLANPYRGKEMPACGTSLGPIRSLDHGAGMGQGNGMGMGQGDGTGMGRGERAGY